MMDANEFARTDPRGTDDEGVAFAAILEALPLAQKVPRGSECLVCYVYRMWRRFGEGTGLELVSLYRSMAARRDVTLEQRLRAAGFATDRDVVFAAHRPDPHQWDPTGYCHLHQPVDGVPWCETVIRGSTAACGIWIRSGNTRPADTRHFKRLWA